MYADLDKIKWVLENRTAYTISKEIGVSNQALFKFINNISSLDNMKLSTAIKLTQYAEQEMMKENIQ